MAKAFLVWQIQPNMIRELFQIWWRAREQRNPLHLGDLCICKLYGPWNLMDWAIWLLNPLAGSTSSFCFHKKETSRRQDHSIQLHKGGGLSDLLDLQVLLKWIAAILPVFKWTSEAKFLPSFITASITSNWISTEILLALTHYNWKMPSRHQSASHSWSSGLSGKTMQLQRFAASQIHYSNWASTNFISLLVQLLGWMLAHLQKHKIFDKREHEIKYKLLRLLLAVTCHQSRQVCKMKDGSNRAELTHLVWNVQNFYTNMTTLSQQHRNILLCGLFLCSDNRSMPSIKGGHLH